MLKYFWLDKNSPLKERMIILFDHYTSVPDWWYDAVLAVVILALATSFFAYAYSR